MEKQEFEVKVVSLGFSEAENQLTLNNLYARGWRLIAVAKDHGFMERPLAPPSADNAKTPAANVQSANPKLDAPSRFTPPVNKPPRR